MTNQYLLYYDEFRTRLIRCLYLFVSIFLILFLISDELYSFVARPLLNQLPNGNHLVAIKVTDTFNVPVKLALILATLLTLPYALSQLWFFVAPALYPREKKLSLPIVSASLILFCLGLLFGFYVMLPCFLKYFTLAAPKGIKVMADINHYLDMITNITFSAALTFQIPLALYLSLKCKLLSLKTLRAQRRKVIIAALILGMLLTPPDVCAQVLMALPIWGFYELALVLAQCFRLGCQTTE